MIPLPQRTTLFPSRRSSDLEGGQITLTFNGPASHDLPTNGKDQELFNFTMASQSNVEVRNTTFQLDTTGGSLDNDATAFYTDVKLVDTATGTVVAGPLDVPRSE